MSPVAKGIDHRVFEVGPAPPGDEAVRLTVPAFILQERCCDFGEPFLHIDDSAVLVKYKGADFTGEN